MLEEQEIQGNILYAYGARFRCASYLLMRIQAGRAADAAPVIAEWLDKVTFGRRPRGFPGGANVPHVNIGFTYAGLKALGVPREMLYAFPCDFRQGAVKRAKELGDTWQDTPEGAEFGQGHLMLTVHGASRESCMTRLNRLLDANASAGSPLTEVRRRDAALIARGDNGSDTSCGTRYSREHFGFADGCSQPAVEGVDYDPQGDGLYTGVPVKGLPVVRLVARLLEDVGLKPIARQWRPVRAGEFILGYESEDGKAPDGPPAPLGPNGTFMVYRELDQDVRAFNGYIRRAEANCGIDKNDVAAKIVGRWPDGTPLVLSSAHGDELIATNRRRANDFLYAERRRKSPNEPDREGFRCPLGAHIRRANPRDVLPGGSERTMRHRIIRRGMPYGEPWTEGENDDEERGLAFVCFNASITNGFEFIQRNWLTAGDAFGLSQPDFLVQQKHQRASMVIQREGADGLVLGPPQEPFVTVRGCAYLFVPSRRACEWLTTVTPRSRSARGSGPRDRFVPRRLLQKLRPHT